MTFTFVPGPHHVLRPERDGPIRSWSFSSLTKFEKCPYSVYLGKVEGLKEPAGPAADRGSRIHAQWEAFIKGETDRLTEAGKKPDVAYAEQLRDLYAQAMATVEDEWCFDKNWQIVEPRSEEVWAVFKLDVFVRESPTSARVIDHKSGRSFGNDVKHGEQGMFYAIAALMREPDLQFVKVEFNYVDEGQIISRGNWRREDLELFLPRLTKRGSAMTSAIEFPPIPSKPNCKWCRYKDEVKRETGEPACVWGVID